MSEPITFEEADQKVVAAGFQQWMLGRDESGTYMASVKRVGEPYSFGPDAEDAATPTDALLAALEKRT